MREHAATDGTGAAMERGHQLAKYLSCCAASQCAETHICSRRCESNGVRNQDDCTLTSVFQCYFSDLSLVCGYFFFFLLSLSYLPYFFRTVSWVGFTAARSYLLDGKIKPTT